MNTFNFLQIGGYPLETDTLDEMQKAYNIFNALGALAGDKTIISGCMVTGDTISDGVVYLNGELYNFVGGTIQSTVRILETPLDKEFENGETKTVLIKKVVSFASGEGSIPWEDFTRVENLKNLQSRILPAGVNPQLFSGDVNAIPEGWQLCDGTNDTPDLRGQFVVGFDDRDEDYDTVGNTGGEKEVELSVSELPAHDHGGDTGSNGSHNHTYKDSYHIESVGNQPSAGGVDNIGGNNYGSASSDNDNRYLYYRNGSTNSNGNHNHSIPSEGNGAAHENRPPYYTLAYIIYTGQ